MVSDGQYIMSFKMNLSHYDSTKFNGFIISKYIKVTEVFNKEKKKDYYYK